MVAGGAGKTAVVARSNELVAGCDATSHDATPYSSRVRRQHGVEFALTLQGVQFITPPNRTLVNEDLGNGMLPRQLFEPLAHLGLTGNVDRLEPDPLPS